MQVRDGPAAVRGDARRGNATGRQAGKAAEGEPRVRRPAALPDLEPLAEGGFVLRRLIILSLLLAAILTPTALAAERQDPGRRQDADDLRRRPAGRHRRQRPAGARRRQHRRRVLLRAHVLVVRGLRQPDRQVRGRRHGRLGVQGERGLASGRGRQGRAEGRRHRALVLRDLRRHRRAADARAAASAAQLLPRPVGQRPGEKIARDDRRAHGRRTPLPDQGGPRVHR